MFPTRPEFKPIASQAIRQAIFGTFEFEAAPTSDNPENIVMRGDWARKNLVSVELPQLSGIPGAPHSVKIQCHLIVADPIRFLFENLEQEKVLADILHWDGCFCPRFQRGSTTALSNHSWGTAFDVNAAFNPFRHAPAADGVLGCVYRLVPIAARHRFYWGGFFGERPDGMHFEYVGP
jgi:hypothetical protein